MIVDIPSSDDLNAHSLLFLNLAWDSVFKLLDVIIDLEEIGSRLDDETSDAYLHASKHPLLVAHALAQQGAELALKSCVASVSPFLLIAGTPRDWPKHSDKGDMCFSEFHTIDALELVKAYNTVCGSKLDENFIDLYERYRKQRNALFHTVDRRLKTNVIDSIEYILETAHIARPGEWTKIRREYILESPDFVINCGDYAHDVVCREMRFVIKNLSAKALQRFFNYNKKQRSYICPNCYYECSRDFGESFPVTAQLSPNEPNSTTLYCFVCDSRTPVLRHDCIDDECKGNVINADNDHNCLTCFVKN